MSIAQFDGKLIHDSGLELCYDPDVTGLPLVQKAVIVGTFMRSTSLKAFGGGDGSEKSSIIVTATSGLAAATAAVRAASVTETVSIFVTPRSTASIYEYPPPDDGTYQASVRLYVQSLARRLSCETAKIANLRDCVTSVRVGPFNIFEDFAAPRNETVLFRYGLTHTAPTTGADIMDACDRSMTAAELLAISYPYYYVNHAKIEFTDSDDIDMFFETDTSDETGRTGKTVYFSVWIDAQPTASTDDGGWFYRTTPLGPAYG